VRSPWGGVLTPLISDGEWAAHKSFYSKQQLEALILRVVGEHEDRKPIILDRV